MKLKKILNLSSAVLMGVSVIPINALISPTIVQAAGEESEATEINLTVHLTNGQQEFGSKKIPVKTNVPFSAIKSQFARLFGVDRLTILFDGSEIDDEMTLDDLDVADNLDPDGVFTLQATTTSEQPTATVDAQPAVEQTSVAGIDIGNSNASVYGIASSILRANANQKISNHLGIDDYVDNPHGNEDVTIERDSSGTSFDLTKFDSEQQENIAKLRRGESVDYGKSPFKVSRWENLQKMYQVTDRHGKHFSPQPKKLMFFFFKSGGKDYYLPVISMGKLPEDDFFNFINGNIYISHQKANPEQVPELRPVISSLFDALLALHQHKIAYGDDIGHSIAVDPVTKKISLTTSQLQLAECPQSNASESQFRYYYRKISTDNTLIINCLKYLQQNDQSKLGSLLAIYDQLPEQDRNLLLQSDKLLAVINEKLGDFDQADQEIVTPAFQEEVATAFTAIIKEMGGSGSKVRILPPTKSVASQNFSPRIEKPQPRPAPVAPPTPKMVFTAPALLGSCNSVSIGDFKGSRGASELNNFILHNALDSSKKEVGQQVAQFFQINNFLEAENDPSLTYISLGANYTKTDGKTKIVIEEGASHRLDSSRFNRQQLEALARIRQGKSVDFSDCPLICPEYANLLYSWPIMDHSGRHLTQKPGKIMFVFYKLNDVEYYLPIFSMDHLADQTTIRDVFRSDKSSEQTKMAVLQSLLDVMIQCHQHNLSFNFDDNDILVDQNTNQVSLQRSGNFCLRNANEEEDSASNKRYWRAFKEDLNHFFGYIKQLKIDEHSKLNYLCQQYQDSQKLDHHNDAGYYRQLREILPEFKVALGGNLVQASNQLIDLDADNRRGAQAKQILIILKQKTSQLAINTENLRIMKSKLRSARTTNHDLLVEFINAINQQRKLNSERAKLLAQIKDLDIDFTNRNYLNVQEQETYRKLVISAQSFPTAEEEMSGVCQIIYRLLNNRSLNNQISNDLRIVTNGYRYFAAMQRLKIVSERLDYYSGILAQVRGENETKAEDLAIINAKQREIRTTIEQAKK